MPMSVISVIDVDMLHPSANVVNAKQYDTSARIIEVHLKANGQAWVVPNNAFPVIRYRKSDRIGGYYDIDDNGIYAIAYGSTRDIVYVTLAFQTLTTAGIVNMELNFYDPSTKLSAFAWQINVEASTLSDDEIISSQYYNALTEVANNVVDDAVIARDSANAAMSSASEAASWKNNMPSLVQTWLNTNITNPTSPVIDKTLTLENAAAESKTVGQLKDDLYDKMNEVNSDVYDLSKDLYSGKQARFQNVESDLIGLTFPQYSNRIRLNSITGKTIKWRQDANQAGFATGARTTLVNSDLQNRTGTWRPTSVGSTCIIGGTVASLFYNSHIYLLSADLYLPVASDVGCFIAGSSRYGYVERYTTVPENNWTRVYIPVTSASDAATSTTKNVYFYIYTDESGWTTNSEIKMRNLNVFDLTEMFDTGNEPTIEEFIEMFPAGYYSPSGLVLRHADAKKVISQSRNLFNGIPAIIDRGLRADPSGMGSTNPSVGKFITDYIPVCGDTEYYININLRSTVWGTCYYDENKTLISGHTSIASNMLFRTPSHARYIRTTGEIANITSVCINKSDSLDGIVTPYVHDEAEIPVDSSVVIGYGQSNNETINVLNFNTKLFDKKGYYSEGAWVDNQSYVYINYADIDIKVDEYCYLYFETSFTDYYNPNITVGYELMSIAGGGGGGGGSGDGLTVYENIDEMVLLFNEEVDLCYVLNDNSRYGDSYRGNFYKYNETVSTGEIELLNGGCAELVIGGFNPISENNSESVSTIIDIAESYLNTGVVYKSNNGPFMPEANRHGGLQCSQFLSCLLLGLYYSDSKLANENNNNELINGGVSYIKQFIPTGVLSAWEFTKYAACHGWFNKTNKLTNCEVGDAVSFYIRDGSANWRSISHIAMVVAKQDGKVILVQAGGKGNSYEHQRVEYYIPYSDDDAVNYMIILDENYDLDDGYSGIYGFSRFPINYRTPSQEETDLYNAAINSL